MTLFRDCLTRLTLVILVLCHLALGLINRSNLFFFFDLPFTLGGRLLNLLLGWLRCQLFLRLFPLLRLEDDGYSCLTFLFGLFLFDILICSLVFVSKQLPVGKLSTTPRCQCFQ